MAPSAEHSGTQTSPGSEQVLVSSAQALPLTEQKPFVALEVPLQRTLKSYPLNVSGLTADACAVVKPQTTCVHGAWRSFGIVAPLTSRERLQVLSSISRASPQFVVEASARSCPDTCVPPVSVGLMPSVAVVAQGRIVRAES